MPRAMAAPAPVIICPTTPKTVPSSPRSSPCSPLPLSSPKLELTCHQKKKLYGGSGSGQSLESETVLKRKRPPRLDVRVAPEAAWSLAAVETPQRVEEVEAEEDGYSVYCKRGRRGPMEDRYYAVVDPGGAHREAFFGVFDGHGGSKAAEFAAMNLDKNIQAEFASAVGEDYSIERAIRDGYLKTDEEFLKQGMRGGACCVTALICKGELAVSNAGDCRAVISRGGVAEALTSDHQPSQENEQKRIEALGGYVDHCNGVWRIHGTLAVSRGIGDGYLKQWVTAEPETKTLHIKPELEFLILASDGLWDKVTNQEAVDVVRPLCVGVEKMEPLVACKKLAELSAKRGSLDDISVMIIKLGNFAP